MCDGAIRQIGDFAGAQRRTTARTAKTNVISDMKNEASNGNQRDRLRIQELIEEILITGVISSVCKLKCRGAEAWLAVRICRYDSTTKCDPKKKPQLRDLCKPLTYVSWTSPVQAPKSS